MIDARRAVSLRAPQRRAVMLFTRTPRSEASAKPLGGLSFAERVRLYRELIQRVVRVALGTGDPVVIVTDDPTDPFTNEFGAVRVIAQRGETFGERMATAFGDVFALGFDEITCVGNDCPSLTSAILKSGFTALETHDVVLGAATDGGVNVMAFSRNASERIPTLFTECRWQSRSMRADLIAAAERHGFACAVFTSHDDIDTQADIRSAARTHPDIVLLRIAAGRLHPRHRLVTARLGISCAFRCTIRLCPQKSPPWESGSPVE